MTRDILLLGTIGAILFLPGTGSTTIWHVHPDSTLSSIQTGIDCSSDGDTVLVYPATYVESVNFNGKNILLGSLFLTTGDTSYISSTIIDGDSAGSVVTFAGGEDSTAVITGFKIENGYDSNGGGIICHEWSSPTITGNTITGNTADQGGGIYCSSSSPTITGNTIAGNATEYGGSIYCYSSSPAITNCTITDNLAHNFGGGIYCTNQSSPTIVNCILWACSPDEIYVHSSRPLVTYSDIKGGWEGEGNTDCDPWFCYPDTGNYYLAENSCCIGAGQGGANMGALGIGCDAYLLFIRADANADSAITIGDAIYTIKYLCIPGSPAPVCMKSADSDDSGDIAMSDAVYTLECLFVPGTPQPPAPFPSCGVDATEDGLDCASYPPCGTGENTKTNQITASR